MLKVWIIDQNCSLVTYLTLHSPLPVQIIHDFNDILSELWVWCADRAALILVIKIDEPKIRENYERHLLFTVMVRIRKLCYDTYGDIAENEKTEPYIKPMLEKPIKSTFTFKVVPGDQFWLEIEILFFIFKSKVFEASS